MEHTIKATTQDNIIETSYHDLVIRASKNEIVKKLGIKPIYNRKGKTKYDWYLILDDKFPFTIYDYKEGRLKANDVIEYHIGWKPEFWINGEFSNQELDNKTGFPKRLEPCEMIVALEYRGLTVDQSDSWKRFYGPNGYFNKK
jgi:hypothetical protein